MKKLFCFISVPFILAWIVLTATLLWLKSSGFRNETKELLGKTGRSKRVLVRYLSKKTSKEIADVLNVSETTVNFHRKNLRVKFGLRNKRTNLRSYLLSISQ